MILLQILSADNIKKIRRNEYALAKKNVIYFA